MWPVYLRLNKTNKKLGEPKAKNEKKVNVNKDLSLYKTPTQNPKTHKYKVQQALLSLLLKSKPLEVYYSTANMIINLVGGYPFKFDIFLTLLQKIRHEET